MGKDEKAKVLVVDDHCIVLEGICSVINGMSEAAVANAVVSGKEALCLIAKCDYDVYVLDVNIPDISGFDLIKVIRELNPQARIIINTMHEEVWIVNRLLRCKVNAITLKSSATVHLANAVRSVLYGDSYACPRFSSIKQKLQSSTTELQSAETPTKRELDVLRGVAKGLNSGEIASMLKISENTVETFRRRLIAKFDAKNSTEMAVKAMAKGWIKLE